MIEIIPTRLADGGSVELQGMSKRARGERLRPLTTGSVPFRKAYFQSLIGSIEVDDNEVRIKGSKDLLEKAVLAGQIGPSGCSQASTRWHKDANTYVIVIPI